ncbi:unnamed protein product [Soboliphyme baturini]|uniref:RING-type E3 ubiquitin transferase n=1 Tax=Soboliphyme baturini TaxID=241478 RepID=A0A183J5I0_9BILA|nr:unnamed protein product [Soboliphyme baturini]
MSYVTYEQGVGRVSLCHPSAAQQMQCSLRDAEFIRLLVEKACRATEGLTGVKVDATWFREMELLVQVIYYAVNVVNGNQTLGEELAHVLMTDASTEQAPSPLKRMVRTVMRATTFYCAVKLYGRYRSRVVPPVERPLAVRAPVPSSCGLGMQWRRNVVNYCVRTYESLKFAFSSIFRRFSHHVYTMADNLQKNNKETFPETCLLDGVSCIDKLWQLSSTLERFPKWGPEDYVLLFAMSIKLIALALNWIKAKLKRKRVDDSGPTKKRRNVDGQLSCLLCQSENNDPCCLRCGHMFCAECCFRQRTESGVCSLCGFSIKADHIVPVLNY